MPAFRVAGLQGSSLLWPRPGPTLVLLCRAPPGSTQDEPISQRVMKQVPVASILSSSGISLPGQPQPLQQPPLQTKQSNTASYRLCWYPSGGRSFLSFFLGWTHLQAFSLQRKPSYRLPGDRSNMGARQKHGLVWLTTASPNTQVMGMLPVHTRSMSCSCQ